MAIRKTAEDRAGVKGIIFDMDGVITDSIPIHWGIWAELGRKYGYDVTQELIARLNGMNTITIAEYLIREYGLSVTAEELAQEKRKPVIPRLEHEVMLFDGVREVLDNLRGKGLLIGLGTSSYRQHAEIIIRKLLPGFEFDAFVTQDDVEFSKPAPDIFLKCAERMGLSPDECIVVEDAPNGIRAAKLAGMKAVAITTSSAREVLQRDDIGADAIIDDIREIDEGLIRKLEKS